MSRSNRWSIQNAMCNLACEDSRLLLAIASEQNEQHGSVIYDQSNYIIIRVEEIDC